MLVAFAVSFERGCVDDPASSEEILESLAHRLIDIRIEHEDHIVTNRLIE